MSHSSLVERGLGASATAALAGLGGVRRASAGAGGVPGASSVSMELPDDAYTTLGGDMKSCKILNGASSDLDCLAMHVSIPRPTLTTKHNPPQGCGS